MKSDFRFQISDLRFAVCGVAMAALLIAGCIGSKPSNPAATQPVTIKNLATTQPAYWLDQPGVTGVENFQFQPLWDACEKVARSYLFALDRQDFRLGLLTTRPMISKAILEPWRKDAGTFHAVVQDSLTTIRRTLRFEIEHTDDGVYVMTPKVLVERETVEERQITNVISFRTAFAGPATGTRDAELEPQVPVIYWTAIGRDTAMEQQVADAVRKQIKEAQ
jgi:hypothetical protein